MSGSERGQLPLPELPEEDRLWAERVGVVPLPLVGAGGRTLGGDEERRRGEIGRALSVREMEELGDPERCRPDKL